MTHATHHPLATHTPGPWHVEHPFGEPGVYVQATTTALICKLYSVDGRWVGDKIEAIESNARLIAAAPAMLDALRGAAETMRIMQQQLVGCAAWLKNDQPYVSSGTAAIAEQALVDIAQAHAIIEQATNGR